MQVKYQNKQASLVAQIVKNLPTKQETRDCFCYPGFQHVWWLLISTVLGFLCIQFPPRELSPSWASAVLGLHFTGAKLRLFQPG